MFQDTIEKLEAKIQNAGSIKDDNKAELMSLLSVLKSEIAELSKTHVEHAESISGFSEVSTHEATRKEKNPELLKLSIEGLSTSVEGFEKSHPELVEAVNSICLLLSNIGI